MSRSFFSSLPSLYQNALSDFFEKEAPKESKATCANCVMCAPPQQALTEEERAEFFRDDTKCCTYMPFLPNYLVGGILQDESPELAEGRQRMRARIAARIGITPRWVRPSQRYTALFMRKSSAKAFGRAPSLRCPYYETHTGNCTVWRYREAVCSTFFCKHDQGQDGKQFWDDLKYYLRCVEERLTYESARRVAPELVDQFETAALTEELLDVEDIEELPPRPSKYRNFWQEWEGREEEYYRACYEAARQFTQADFQALFQEREHAAFADVKNSYARLYNPLLPEILKRADDLLIFPMPNDFYKVVGYSWFDPMMLSPALHALLDEFRGEETVEQIKARLLRDYQLPLEDELLFLLYHQRFLIDANTATQEPSQETQEPSS